MIGQQITTECNEHEKMLNEINLPFFRKENNKMEKLMFRFLSN